MRSIKKKSAKESGRKKQHGTQEICDENSRLFNKAGHPKSMTQQPTKGVAVDERKLTQEFRRFKVDEKQMGEERKSTEEID